MLRGSHAKKDEGKVAQHVRTTVLTSCYAFFLCAPPSPISFSFLSQGIFLVYDISSERSYQHIMKWVSDVDEVGDTTLLTEVGKGASGEGKTRARWEGLKLSGLLSQCYQETLSSTALDAHLWVSHTEEAEATMPSHSVLCEASVAMSSLEL
jgi:Ras-related protein Rab-15